MLHRSFRLQWISEDRGHGLFASEFIPKGTITFVNDDLDVIIDPHDQRFHKEPYLSLIERYAYSNPKGEKVLCWDFGKYMNHCCDPNSMTTGYGFDIALKDIPTGQEITTDYGVFTVAHDMIMNCDKLNCRKFLDVKQFDQNVETWDQRIRQALVQLRNVPQMLIELIDKETLSLLNKYLDGDELSYVSVSTQKPKEPLAM